jgi:DNA-binding transcriptional LysR family regulator
MPQLEAGFYEQVLFSQRFVCVASQAHPRIGQRFTKAAFGREQHVLVSASGTGHVIVDKMLARAGVERRIALRVPSFLGVASIVAETELIAIVPSHYATLMQRRERIRILPMPHALPGYDVKQHWHARFHSDPGNAWMRRAMAELMKPGSGLTNFATDGGV